MSYLSAPSVPHSSRCASVTTFFHQKAGKSSRGSENRRLENLRYWIARERNHRAMLLAFEFPSIKRNPIDHVIAREAPMRNDSEISRAAGAGKSSPSFQCKSNG